MFLSIKQLIKKGFSLVLPITRKVKLGRDSDRFDFVLTTKKSSFQASFLQFNNPIDYGSSCSIL
jgi:hypothetical protein